MRKVKSAELYTYDQVLETYDSCNLEYPSAKLHHAVVKLAGLMHCPHARALTLTTKSYI